LEAITDELELAANGTLLSKAAHGLFFLMSSYLRILDGIVERLVCA
jgi:hypothetical protein